MRGLEILSILSEYFLFYKSNNHKNKILGRRIKEACETLGPTFIKFGQMLSTRYDVLSEKDCEELQKLLDNVKPFPYEKVKEIFKHDFGKYPEEIFEEFNLIASASVSQVYKAKLSSGKYLAVKVRRPYIGHKIYRDMNILKNCARVSKLFSKTLRMVNVVKLVEEMKSWLLQEIDFENEVKNIIEMKKYYNFCDNKRFGKNLKGGTFITPQVKLCSKNIITMDFIDGVPLNKINLIKDNPEYDIYLSLKSYVNAATHALFHKKGYYLFQADPHPANILILKNGGCASIDYGLVGRISPSDLEKMKKLFLSVYLGSVENTIKASLNMCGASYEKYAKKIRKDMEVFLSKTPYEGIGFWFMEPVRIFVKHGISVPCYLSAFGRCNFVMDGSFKLFDSSKTTLDLIDEELKYSVRKEIIKNIKNIKYQGLLYSLSEKFKESPEKLNQLFDRYYNNPNRLLFDMNKIIKSFVS